ncbi:PLP-dependent aspartate aminotransferase family protein [Fusobacterium simiae]|uniref:PLP-dependent aspartate aminotransferase family protein n=1 Tax=Fusobacterium simiae TaxID=855 RepID=A0ABT4DGT8_FUSSI|nr:PLP-dependent aspartate aminotransferase family protein [Fusobacterium simiae]MCY7007807.1 PLP-dependent aspartate aminotransferase family protein [Fusobacterium simiae]
MFKEFDETLSFETNILEAGAYFRLSTSNPEALPIHLTTAHNVEDLEDLQKRYDEKGFCYNRNRNPNRTALIELMNYVEGGEDSIGCSSGMAAISSSIIAHTKAGDHILSDKTLYGETLEIFTKILQKYGVETTFVDFTNIEEVKKNIKPNTVILYTETVSNPLIGVPNLKILADIAHSNNAIFIVDNTFMTGALVQPLKFGADIVVNSLTKFANGHSDVVCGAATGKSELIKKIYELQVLLGTQSDPFSSWLTMRGMRTLELRIKKQCENASALALELEKSPYVLKVNHPSLVGSPYHNLAHEQFGDYYGGMLSIELPEDLEKMNKFMKALKLAHYAMTLGGYRTSFAYPVMSSHSDMTRDERLAIGITDGLLRISVGIENTKDLINDFKNALEVAYGNK